MLFPHERFADVQAYEDASDAIDVIVDDIAVAMGGSITAEHGVGTSYRKRLARSKSTAELSLMKGIKQLLDPTGLMNPARSSWKPARTERDHRTDTRMPQ